jgi:hypothetical protein
LKRRQFLVGAIVAFGLLARRAEAEGDVVAFNVQTLKYHGLACVWAQRSTRHCVTIERADAIKRGGVPCKVCGGR